MRKAEAPCEDRGVVGDALWNFVTWGNPEGIGWVFDDLVVLALLGLLVWLARAWRRNHR